MDMKVPASFFFPRREPKKRKEKKVVAERTYETLPGYPPDTQAEIADPRWTAWTALLLEYLREPRTLMQARAWGATKAPKRWGHSAILQGLAWLETMKLARSWCDEKRGWVWESHSRRLVSPAVLAKVFSVVIVTVAD